MPKSKVKCDPHGDLWYKWSSWNVSWSDMDLVGYNVQCMPLNNIRIQIQKFFKISSVSTFNCFVNPWVQSSNFFEKIINLCRDVQYWDTAAKLHRTQLAFELTVHKEILIRRHCYSQSTLSCPQRAHKYQYTCQNIRKKCKILYKSRGKIKWKILYKSRGGFFV